MGQLGIVKLRSVARKVGTEGVQQLQTCGEGVHRCLAGAPDLLQGSVMVDPRGFEEIASNERPEHPYGVIVLDHQVETRARVVEPAPGLVAKEATEEVVELRFDRPLVVRVEIEELVNVDDHLRGDGVVIFQTGEVVLALVGAVVACGEVVTGVARVEHQIVEGYSEADGGGHDDRLLDEEGWGRGEGC